MAKIIERIVGQIDWWDYQNFQQGLWDGVHENPRVA